MILSAEEEQRIIRRGRIQLSAVLSVSLLILSLLFSFKFELSFWILRFQSQPSINLLSSVVLFAIVFGIYVHLEPFAFKIRRFTLTARRWSGRPIRIAQLSDTHVHFPYPQVTASRMLDIVRTINHERPDLVFFTGDLMSDGSRFESRDIRAIVNSLKFIESPLFVCFGNHDVDCHVALIESLRQIGAVTLEQQTTEFRIGDHSFYISGLKPSLILGETVRYVEELSRGFHGDGDKCHFLLAHMPDAADSAASAGIFDIQFSGHSHGGQCVLPLNAGTPFLPPGSLKYHGCVTNNYKVGQMLLHVSRGIGVTPLPYPLIRFLCPPEISILTITGPGCSVV
jgi:predicted MPP superfamily phosphohydrolase